MLGPKAYKSFTFLAGIVGNDGVIEHAEVFE